MIESRSFSGRGRTLVELRRFFDQAVRASFKDLAITDEPAATYLADLLTRFARTENLFPPGVALPRLETVVDMLLDVQSAWEENFQPEHEVSVRRHIGDYTMFMTGVFRERVERLASHAFYVVQGKRAYHFVSEHARDRKSTRLNSSHGYISYAVFCLKKKKKQQDKHINSEHIA